MVALPGHHEGSAPDCAFEARLIPLMPPEQEAALAAVLGLLSPEEQRALLAQIAETLEHAGHDDDAALLRVAMRTQVVAPAACFCGAFTNLNPPASFCPSP